ncbi:MAG: hypothetical protein KME64_41170 [Scytonematopsis contorta HA4267-MV1]|nr:hypothetical protein [Scytonematopsis contorta HA4267-MV1]
MSRKKGLGEVKKLGGFKKKTNKDTGIFVYSEDWEVGELVSENADDLYCWQYAADGSLEECLEKIAFYLSMETHMESMKYVSDDPGFSIEAHFENMEKLRTQKLEAVKRECLTNGKYEGRGWEIRSQRTREQCDWLKRNGYPIVN